MSKVDIIRKHIGSEDFYDLNGTEMLSKILAAMDEYAQEQVKLFAIPDVMHRFSSNDVDGAYLLGVFNISGIDGLQKEIERLKELKVNPHNVINSIKSNGA